MNLQNYNAAAMLCAALAMSTNASTAHALEVTGGVTGVGVNRDGTVDVRMNDDQVLCPEGGGKVKAAVLPSDPGRAELLSVLLAAQLSGRRLELATWWDGGQCRVGWAILR